MNNLKIEYVPITDIKPYSKACYAVSERQGFDYMRNASRRKDGKQKVIRINPDMRDSFNGRIVSFHEKESGSIPTITLQY